MLLTPQFEHLTPYIPKYFMYGEVSIQLQDLWRLSYETDN